MMRELTGKVIDLLEDSSLEAIKVSANRQTLLDVSVLCILHWWGHSTVADINASNACCA
jgi:hypothetical protein